MSRGGICPGVSVHGGFVLSPRSDGRAKTTLFPIEVSAKRYVSIAGGKGEVSEVEKYLMT